MGGAGGREPPCRFDRRYVSRARYEHLPIYRAAFDLAVHIEKIVHNISRYHKYTLGSELRSGSRRILVRIIEANQSRDRGPVLEQLRRELEGALSS